MGQEIITELQALKMKAVQARLYYAAACLRDAEAKIIKEYEQSTKLCCTCQVPSFNTHWPGHLVPLWADI